MWKTPTGVVIIITIFNQKQSIFMLFGRIVGLSFSLNSSLITVELQHGNLYYKVGHRIRNERNYGLIFIHI